MNNGASNMASAQCIVAELHRRGVSYFGVAPGSRSSPLALAVAENHEVASTVHFDERGLAYHAIGYIRGSGKPAAIICTSGTAVANFSPAVVEASQDNLPLIVLTADRPPELRDCGANQTIDQLRIFGDYVKYFADLPCPDGNDSAVYGAAIFQLLGNVRDALRAALGPPGGPVHFNCPYREPLVPEILDTPIPITHFTRRQAKSADRVDRRALDGLAARLAESRRGLLLIGRLTSGSERTAVAKLCRRLDWPVVADITSGLRASGDRFLHGPHDLVFKNEHARSRINPDFALHLGGQMVSKHLLTFLSERRGVEYWSCSGGCRPFDPAHVVTTRVEGDLTAIADAISAAPPPASDPNFRHFIQSAVDTVERTVDDFLANNTPFTEFALARALACACDGDHLFLASSLTIRDFDWFTPRGSKIGMIAANRGTSGIDGTIASAVGFAQGLKAPVTLVLGDQATLHDLNSLALVAKSEYPVTVIVVNNRGGRIFEMLPVAQHHDHFEHFFAAAHGFTFENAAAMFRLTYARVETTGTLVDSWTAARSSNQSRMIEATVDPASASRARRALFDLIDEKLSEL